MSAGYGLIVYGKEAKDIVGNVVTRDGQAFWVINGEWGFTSSLYSGPMAPPNLKLFSTKEEAGRFAKAWRGHPWWCKPKEHRVVMVSPVYSLLVSGYNIEEEA
jgi:hypothetical protein